MKAALRARRNELEHSTTLRTFFLRGSEVKKAANQFELEQLFLSEKLLTKYGANSFDNVVKLSLEINGNMIR